MFASQYRASQAQSDVSQFIYYLLLLFINRSGPIHSAVERTSVFSVVVYVCACMRHMVTYVTYVLACTCRSTWAGRVG